MDESLEEMFRCDDCGWIGDARQVPVQRDGDAYDKWTNFWRECPKCGSKNVEESN